MSHPYYHAASSVRQFGGQEGDYLEIHQWFDATKAHMANFRHRALRHHAFGIATAISVFDQRRVSHKGMIVNSDGESVSIEAIAKQHITEDCGQCPSAVDWVLGLNTEQWMIKQYRVTVEEQIDKTVATYGGLADDYRAIHEWFHKPYSFLPQFKARFFLYHSQGIFTCEEVFGAVIRNSQNFTVPVRAIAEMHVLTELGQIPTATSWLSAVVAEPWMQSKASKLSKEFAKPINTSN